MVTFFKVHLRLTRCGPLAGALRRGGPPRRRLSSRQPGSRQIGSACEGYHPRAGVPAGSGPTPGAARRFAAADTTKDPAQCAARAGHPGSAERAQARAFASTHSFAVRNPLTALDVKRTAPTSPPSTTKPPPLPPAEALVRAARKVAGTTTRAPSTSAPGAPRPDVHCGKPSSGSHPTGTRRIPREQPAASSRNNPPTRFTPWYRAVGSSASLPGWSPSRGSAPRSPSRSPRSRCRWC